ncbi:MAG TPA: hypothetical protein [Caudoviricetes sp.]|nr:MAG TPA: hypothetical protein [Caudoviricetes sp.]
MKLLPVSSTALAISSNTFVVVSPSSKSNVHASN